jgi:hypothetical protein
MLRDSQGSVRKRNSAVDFNTGSGEVLRLLTTGAADGTFISSGLTNPTFMTFTDVPEPALPGLLSIASVILIRRRTRAGKVINNENFASG